MSGAQLDQQYSFESDEVVGPIDIRRAVVRRPGRDVSLITYGGSLGKVLHAAEVLALDGIDAEVIDLRALRPLDLPTILASVAKTRRAKKAATWRMTATKNATPAHQPRCSGPGRRSGVESRISRQV